MAPPVDEELREAEPHDGAEQDHCKERQQPKCGIQRLVPDPVRHISYGILVMAYSASFLIQDGILVMAYSLWHISYGILGMAYSASFLIQDGILVMAY